MKLLRASTAPILMPSGLFSKREESFAHLVILCH